MLFLFAVATAVTTPPPSAPVTVRATATIRVVQAARVHFGRPNRDLPRPRATLIRSAEGLLTPANLIEFQ